MAMKVSNSISSTQFQQKVETPQKLQGEQSTGQIQSTDRSKSDNNILYKEKLQVHGGMANQLKDQSQKILCNPKEECKIAQIGEQLTKDVQSLKPELQRYVINPRTPSLNTIPQEEQKEEQTNPLKAIEKDKETDQENDSKQVTSEESFQDDIEGSKETKRRSESISKALEKASKGNNTLLDSILSKPLSKEDKNNLQNKAIEYAKHSLIVFDTVLDMLSSKEDKDRFCDKLQNKAFEEALKGDNVLANSILSGLVPKANKDKLSTDLQNKALEEASNGNYKLLNSILDGQKGIGADIINLPKADNDKFCNDLKNEALKSASKGKVELLDSIMSGKIKIEPNIFNAVVNGDKDALDSLKSKYGEGIVLTIKKYHDSQILNIENLDLLKSNLENKNTELLEKQNKLNTNFTNYKTVNQIISKPNGISIMSRTGKIEIAQNTLNAVVNGDKKTLDSLKSKYGEGIVLTIKKYTEFSATDKKIKDDLKQINGQLSNIDKIKGRILTLSNNEQEITLKKSEVERKIQELSNIQKPNEIKSKKKEIENIQNEIKSITSEVKKLKTSLYKMENVTELSETFLKPITKFTVGKMNEALDYLGIALFKKLSQDVTEIDVKTVCKNITNETPERKKLIGKYIILKEFKESNLSLTDFNNGVKTQAEEHVKTLKEKVKNENPFLPEKQLKARIDHIEKEEKVPFVFLEKTLKNYGIFLTNFYRKSNKEYSETIHAALSGKLTIHNIEQMADSAKNGIPKTIEADKLLFRVQHSEADKTKLAGDISTRILQGVEKKGNITTIAFDREIKIKAEVKFSPLTGIGVSNDIIDFGVGVAKVGVGVQYAKNDTCAISRIHKKGDEQFELVLQKGSSVSGQLSGAFNLIEARIVSFAVDAGISGSIGGGKGWLNGIRLRFKSQEDANEFLKAMLLKQITPEILDKANIYDLQGSTTSYNFSGKIGVGAKFTAQHLDSSVQNLLDKDILRKHDTSKEEETHQLPTLENLSVQNITSDKEGNISLPSVGDAMLNTIKIHGHTLSELTSVEMGIEVGKAVKNINITSHGIDGTTIEETMSTRNIKNLKANIKLSTFERSTLEGNIITATKTKVNDKGLITNYENSISYPGEAKSQFLKYLEKNGVTKEQCENIEKLFNKAEDAIGKHGDFRISLHRNLKPKKMEEYNNAKTDNERKKILDDDSNFKISVKSFAMNKTTYRSTWSKVAQLLTLGIYKSEYSQEAQRNIGKVKFK